MFLQYALNTLRETREEYKPSLSPTEPSTPQLNCQSLGETNPPTPLVIENQKVESLSLCPFRNKGRHLESYGRALAFVSSYCVSLTTHIAFPEQCIPRLFTATLPHIWLHIRDWPHTTSYSATRFACITCAKGWNRDFRGLIALSRKRWT